MAGVSKAQEKAKKYIIKNELEKNATKMMNVLLKQMPADPKQFLLAYLTQHMNPYELRRAGLCRIGESELGIGDEHPQKSLAEILAEEEEIEPPEEYNRLCHLEERVLNPPEGPPSAETAGNADDTARDYMGADLGDPNVNIETTAEKVDSGRSSSSRKNLEQLGEEQAPAQSDDLLADQGAQDMIDGAPHEEDHCPDNGIEVNEKQEDGDIGNPVVTEEVDNIGPDAPEGSSGERPDEGAPLPEPDAVSPPEMSHPGTDPQTAQDGEIPEHDASAVNPEAVESDLANVDPKGDAPTTDPEAAEITEPAPAEADASAEVDAPAADPEATEITEPAPAEADASPEENAPAADPEAAEITEPAPVATDADAAVEPTSAEINPADGEPAADPENAVPPPGTMEEA